VIRLWEMRDADAVGELILPYLKEVQGLYDYLPTSANAHFLFILGLANASVGAPVLLCEIDGKIVGWTSWVAPPSTYLEFKGK